MSCFQEHSKNMMQRLHNLGFSLKYLEAFLEEFDYYVDQHCPTETLLTSELAENWIHSSQTKSKQQLDKRVRTMRYLGKYLSSIGIDSYIPSYHIKADPPKPPQLFTDEELAIFFSVSDLIKPHYLSPNKEYIIPIIFRLIYSCGLRSSEACNIRMTDINLETGIIEIYQSKGHKDRIVFMSHSMLELCKLFNEVYSKILPKRIYFFQPSYQKEHYLNTDICGMFNSVLKLSSLDSKHPIKPTPHSLRHLFAVKSMRKCMGLGYSFDNMIKYLSMYMGHKSPQETMYYLHMVSHLLPEYCEKMKEIAKGIGVVYEEE